MLQHIHIHDFKGQNQSQRNIQLSYEVFGKELHTAPVVLINHALTGNSNVAGTNGWWKTLVGPGKIIDTDKLTVLCFNIPGNGYQSPTVHPNQQLTSVAEVAQIFLQGLEKLSVHQLYAIIGGSIGGAIGWEMIAQNPEICQKFIPIATHFQTSDWLHAHCLVQKFLLQSTDQALEKARMHAMLCYRSPESINARFQNIVNETTQNLESIDWLNYHGNALKNRFTLESYQFMNHLLTTIDVNINQLKHTNTEIHLIAVDSDLFFPKTEIESSFHLLKKFLKNICYHEIHSPYGHDAFLIEYEQLNQILNPILYYHEQQYHYHLQEQSAY
ncbi:MAG: alpha/beta fold hydrolase [Bacteroidetes bacterium]|nr:alpha/beta fold hydrolase [Bacteroidota bacterium]